MGIWCRIKLLVATLVIAPTLNFGQSRQCATPDLDLSLPEVQIFNESARSIFRKSAGIVRVIPIAVHVVYNNQHDAHNISDAQIQSQISVLNDDFRGVSGGVDCEIEFCIAGINRIQSSVYYNVSTYSDDFDLKALSQETPTQYLNVWIVNSIDNGQTLGWSSFPKNLGTAPHLDGVVVADDFWGTIGTAANSSPNHLGRTATHEIGHWLNLIHVFQGGCDDNSTCAFMGDCCCDTPPQEKYFYKCKKNKNSCHDDSPDEKDPIRNYMGYSDDDCMDNFTACQSIRMNLTLDSVRTLCSFPKGDECPVLKKDFPASAESLISINLTAYPNPFSTYAKVDFELSTKLRVTMELVDLQGKVLFVPIHRTIFDAGKHTLRLDLTNIDQPVFLRLRSGRLSHTLKLIPQQ